MNVDKFFYINLNRRPDRNEHFLSEANDAHIPSDKIERFEAIDGKTYQFSQDELKMFEKADYINDHRIRNPIMGNQLSHNSILKKVATDDTLNVCVVFQDDVYFCNNFVDKLEAVIDEMPEDTEFVWVGQHLYAAYAQFTAWPLNTPIDTYPKQICHESVTPMIGKTNRNPCSLAYIVTKRGARNILEHYEKVGFRRATDGNMNDYLWEKRLMYATHEVLCTGEPSFGSDIFPF